MTDETHEFDLQWGLLALLELLTLHDDDFTTVLDIGAGAGEQSRFLRLFGKETYSVDLHEDADYTGDFMTMAFDRKFDAVYCSHVLEHQRNVGAFIEKMYDVLADDGILALAVPAHPPERLVSGHITHWNAGLLVYNLILGGFDCSAARVRQRYDLNLVLRKRPAAGGDVRSAAAWSDVGALARYFPFPVAQGSSAAIKDANWDGNYTLPRVGRPVDLLIRNGIVGNMEMKLV